MKKFLCTFLLILMTLCLISCNTSNGVTDNGTGNTEDNKKYDQALKLIENKEYSEAYEILKSLGDYEKAQEQLKNFRYIPVKCVMGEGDTQTGESPYKLAFNIFYNEDHLPVKWGVTVDEETIITYDYIYDSNHHLTGIAERYNSNIESTISYAYDANNNIIQKIYTDYNGKSLSYNYTYDAEGKLIQKTDPYHSITKYTYDIFGNITKIEKGTSYYSTAEYYKNTYDVNNRLIKTETVETKDAELYEYTYDDNNRLIRKFVKDWIQEITFVYTYDIHGNLTKIVTTGPNGTGYNSISLEYELVYSLYDTPVVTEEFTSYGDLIGLFYYFRPIK